jgi:hypothetical protein
MNGSIWVILLDGIASSVKVYHSIFSDLIISENISLEELFFRFKASFLSVFVVDIDLEI